MPEAGPGPASLAPGELAWAPTARTKEARELEA